MYKSGGEARDTQVRLLHTGSAAPALKTEDARHQSHCSPHCHPSKHAVHNYAILTLS